MLRPLKFENTAVEPVVAFGDDMGLSIVELINKYGERLTGDQLIEPVGEILPSLIGALSAGENVDSVVVDDTLDIWMQEKHNASLLQCTEGWAICTDNTGRETRLDKGDTLLIPAETTLIVLDGFASFLQIKF